MNDAPNMLRWSCKDCLAFHCGCTHEDLAATARLHSVTFGHTVEGLQIGVSVPSRLIGKKATDGRVSCTIVGAFQTKEGTELFVGETKRGQAVRVELHSTSPWNVVE